MTEEDEEFNRIERESMMRMKAVAAVVTRGGSRTTIEMAREAGIRYCTCGCLERFASLVRADERARMAEQPAQQEPVAWEVGVVNGVVTRRLASPASPPAHRTWVSLTDEEIQTAWNNVMDGAVFTRREIYKAIEAKLKEKNT